MGPTLFQNWTSKADLDEQGRAPLLSELYDMRSHYEFIVSKTNVGIKNVLWELLWSENAWAWKTVGNSPKEAMKAHVIDAQITWISNYRYLITKSWMETFQNRRAEN